MGKDLVKARGLLQDMASARLLPALAVMAACRLPRMCIRINNPNSKCDLLLPFDIAAPSALSPETMDLPVTKRRSARQLAGRKRSIYYESDTDDDGVELLSDGYDDEPNTIAAAPPPPPPPQRSRKRIRKSRPNTRSSKQTAAKAEKPKKRKQNPWNRPLGSYHKKRVASTVDNSIPSDGVKPAWSSLPVEILRDIFIFASQPIHEQTVTGSANATWLMRAARNTCHALAVPALEAYYLSPSFHTVVQPHDLLDLLRLPTEDTYIKYRYKIKRLQIDVKHLAYSAQNKPLFKLGSLVRETPQLQQLEVIHPTDKPPFRPLKLQKWFYPSDLFDALEETDIRLRTWRWSRDMIELQSPEDMYTMMTQIHSGRSFQHLDRLIICGFDYNDSAEPPASEDEERRASNLTSAISILPSLKDLTLSSCDIVMEDFLLRLPATLERLELTNCLEVTAEMLQTYLMANGSQLRELVLNSNAALSLSFLPGLKAACPKLETLKMDTTYYSEKTNYNDAYAFYDQLLTASEHPTWPPTLRHLEFSNLQKWGADAASTLFQSLIDAAPELPDLRQLTIQAHIDIAWRDRADFRDNWVDKLRAVFLHKTTPPLPYLCSKKRFREWREEQPLKVTPPGVDDEDADTQRKLSHVRITPRKRAVGHIVFSEDEDEEEHQVERSRKDDGRARVQPRRSARVAESQSAASLSATPGPESAGSGAEDGEDDTEDMSVQGLCEVVDIRIDNQRPRETQYTEANFLDSEVSGDEDWHSGAELSDDGYAW